MLVLRVETLLELWEKSSMGPGRQNGWFKRKKREKVDFLEVESSRFVPPCLVSSLRNNFVPRIWKYVTFTSLPLQHSQVVCLFRLWLLAPAVFWLLCTLCTVHSWYLQSAWKVVVNEKNRPNDAIFSAPSLCKRRRVWKAVQELNLNLPQPPNRVCLFDYSLQLFIRRISPIENALALIWIYF